MNTTKKHSVKWTWYGVEEGVESVIETQVLKYATHEAAFNASQDTRYRGDLYAYGKVTFSCVLGGLR